MSWSPRSLRFRLTVLFAVVTTAAIALVGVYLNYALSDQLATREREQLTAKVELFRHVLSETPDAAALEEARHRLGDILVGHEDLRGSVLDPSGKPLLRLSAFAWPSGLLPGATTAMEASTVVNGVPYRVLIAPARLGGGDSTVLVALAHSSAESRLILNRFQATVVLACLFGSILAGGLGYFAAERGLRPLRKMAAAAAAISAERLDDRLHVEDAPLEVREMAASFNAMLKRLETSFRRLSEFSADLAHELRTPLNNLMLHAQVALDRPRDGAQLRDVLASGLEELDRLSRLVNDMLFIAKADHSQVRLAMQDFMLDEEVAKVFEYYEAIADEKQVRLACEGTAAASADRAMVRRAVANLVSNAVRHAEAGSAVQVRLWAAGAKAVVEVENRGAPIAAEETGRVFERFYRARSSGSAATEGSGLGLAIVQSIVHLHGGEASAASIAGGTVFRVTFQAARPRSDATGAYDA